MKTLYYYILILFVSLFLSYDLLGQTECLEGDCINGFGRLKASGWSYEGYFSNGKRDGNGRLIIARADGNEVYEGSWSNGEKHGYGEIEYTSGSTYKGYWSNGLRHGKGTYDDDSDYRTHYEGEWAEGRRNGFGVQRYKDQSSYEGYWSKDREHGRGTLKMYNGDTYDGQFALGKQDGKGAYTYGPQSVYSGDRFEGSYANGQKSGVGVYYFGKGGRVEAQFQYDSPNGYGVEYDIKGNITKCGVWQRGIFVQDRDLSEVAPYLNIQLSSKIHVIVFTDRDDPQIGISAGKTNEFFERIFIKALKDHSQMSVNFVQRSGRDQFTLQEVNAVITGLNTSSDDAILFYYVGHGFNNGYSSFPTMLLGSKTDDPSLRNKSLDEVYYTLKSKPHRLLLCFAEACNKEQVQDQMSSVSWNKTTHYSDQNWDPARIQALFKHASGDFLVCSSEKGQLSYTITGLHGFFTTAFMSAFSEAIKVGSPVSTDWKLLCSRISESTTSLARQAGETQKPYWKQN